MATEFNLFSTISDFVRGVKIPAGATAVKPFNPKRYLGKWYEIARLDYHWERDLNNVTATYSERPDGKIKVDNKGYNYQRQKWEESIGKAVPADKPDEGKLKVSFFGPIYAGYNVIALDKDYNYALVAGSSLDYLWLLSRTPTMPESVKQEYLAKAAAIGYDINKLVWVDQSKNAVA